MGQTCDSPLKDLHDKDLGCCVLHIDETLMVDCPWCSLQTSRTRCEPELHPRFRFKVRHMAISAEPAPEQEGELAGKCFWLLLSYLPQVENI